MKWLLDSRIKYLKDEKISVEVMGHCELRYSNEKQVSLSDFAAVHHTVEIFLECSEMGDPMYAIKALKPGEPVQVKPTGSLTDGDSDVLNGKRFAATGKLKTFTSRAELKEYLTTYGASLTETLSPTVEYLITNTPDSGTAKNKKAIELGIKRITEAQFNEMIGRIT